MSTALFLVRHGQTIWHAENRYAGVSDVALTDTGREQAERLGGWAAGAKLDAVWCSPLGRTRVTAEPAARAAGCVPRVDGELAEVDFGVAEGRTLAELPPAAVAAFRADPVTGAFEGAENPLDAAARGARALRRIAAEHDEGRVLVVAHNTLLRLALCELLGIAPGRYRTVFPALRNCALTEIRVDGDATGLLSYNLPAS
ncbi:histidine phosphatase family protein [Actinomadura rayongensis]|uniref:Histidine phosphatase family protein n=1 Tax=Actinomadura rayongensis TaxID=1429076 RepID=A0A6I4WLX3_9ACTN|nr:histidine phosphatase family protein [Actinomadura rayongensis]MXQ67954.1 histidine phosphatase family protein [Actinomadura rayongensis]